MFERFFPFPRARCQKTGPLADERAIISTTVLSKRSRATQCEIAIYILIVAKAHAGRTARPVISGAEVETAAVRGQAPADAGNKLTSEMRVKNGGQDLVCQDSSRTRVTEAWC